MTEYDAFAEAFRHIAEQSGRESIAETVEWLRAHLERVSERDGKTPDVVILVKDAVEGSYHNNGATFERIVWILESAKHYFMFGDDD